MSVTLWFLLQDAHPLEGLNPTVVDWAGFNKVDLLCHTGTKPPGRQTIDPIDGKGGKETQVEMCLGHQPELLCLH